MNHPVNQPSFCQRHDSRFTLHQQFPEPLRFLQLQPNQKPQQLV